MIIIAIVLSIVLTVITTKPIIPNTTIAIIVIVVIKGN